MALQTSTGAYAVDPSYDDAAVVTPSDTKDATHRLRDVRGLVADVGGTLTVITEAAAVISEKTGSALPAGVAFTVPAGVVLPLRVAYVLLTGTAATGIKALF